MTLKYKEAYLFNQYVTKAFMSKASESVYVCVRKITLSVLWWLEYLKAQQLGTLPNWIPH